ncbi:MAG: hypothetical protein Tsb0020_49150 [Haliangiales bacterium]
MNTRVLVVDDEELVRDSVRAILCPDEAIHFGGLEAAAERLFDDAPPAMPRSSARSVPIHLDEANSGRTAVRMIERALAAERPYALILLDMRMPGWDGLTTSEAIRDLDPRAEILFVTAYSDYAVQEIVDRVGPDVGYLCKPFAGEELRQLCTKAIYDWNRLRNLEALIHILSDLRVTDGQLERLLQNIFDQATMWLGVQSAMLVSFDDARAPRRERSIGVLQDEEFARACLDALAPCFGAERLQQVDELVYLPFGSWALIVFRDGGVQLGKERLYLFQLFLEHSGQAVENARLHQALMAREKLTAMGQAVSYVAHDLRSPIGLINNAAELMRDEPSLPAHCQELLDIIEEATENCIGLVRDVLDFTSTFKLDLITCTVGEVLAKLERSVSSRLRAADIRLAVDAPLEAPLRCDPSKLHRVLENLLSNAIEALSGGDSDAPSIEICVDRVDEITRWSIRDNGPGIPDAIRERIFEPFATMGKSHGTGLGLAIAHQIVAAHGGQLTLEASDASGTIFALTLPSPSPPDA